MQDNAPCQTAKYVKTYLSEEDVTIMEYPTQSSDRNPIENVWKLLDVYHSQIRLCVKWTYNVHIYI